jgi:broad specificity phosphatase PhoE
MTELIIVRHGESEANLYKFFAGHNDIKLTSLGIRQAMAAAEFLKNTHFDSAYSSTLSRAYDTALTIVGNRNIEIRTDPNLCETMLGEWEGKNVDEIKMTEDYAKWKTDIRYRPPGGESTCDVRERVGRALDKIALENEGKKVLVACHGGCIRLLPSYYKKDDSLIRAVPIASNASITTVIYENGIGRVDKYAYDEYLGDIITVFDNGN